MPEPVSAAAFDDRDDLPEWRYLLGRLEATFRAGSFGAAAELVSAIAAAADEAVHHPDIDVRYPDRVHVVLTTHERGGAVTDLDLALAATISRLASEANATSEPTVSQATEIALDAMDIDAVRPFWTAVLAYVDDAPPGYEGQITAIKDPVRIGPPMWFQQMDEPRTERSRFHLDVTVPAEIAEERIAAALAAGGTLVSDEHARSWWVLADPEGNEACICTWQDRS
jgi:4a-hydroxytetrahydrobiopterin dehydratase